MRTLLDKLTTGYFQAFFYPLIVAYGVAGYEVFLYMSLFLLGVMVIKVLDLLARRKENQFKKDRVL